MRVTLDSYQNMGEFLQSLEATPPVWSQFDSDERTRNKWAGSDSFAHAVNLARHGWPEGREKLFSELESIGALPTVAKPSLDWDVCGFLPDIPRAVSGDPDCMFTHNAASVQARPIIRIAVNTVAACSITTESMINRGAAIVSYIDYIENNGYSTEVNVVTKTAEPGSEYLLITTIKNAGEHLDLDRISFAIAHPSHLRRLFFRAMERHGHLRHYYSGYGACQDLTKKQIEDIGCMVYIPRIEVNYRTARCALEHVSKLFKEQFSTGYQDAA